MNNQLRETIAILGDFLWFVPLICSTLAALCSAFVAMVYWHERAVVMRLLADLRGALEECHAARRYALMAAKETE